MLRRPDVEDCGGIRRDQSMAWPVRPLEGPETLGDTVRMDFELFFLRILIFVGFTRCS